MSDFKVVQPDGPLFRLARAPDPWKWPDWAYAGLDGTFGTAPPAIPCPERCFSGLSSSATPVARHGGRAPHRLASANTRVDDL